MYAKVNSSTVVGINGHIIDIEIDLANGIPQFQIVGLPDSAIREAKDRVRAAIKNAGYDFPMKRITINLAPANLKKEGSGFDLPIAIGILIASEQLDIKKIRLQIEETLFIGELSLDGSIQGIDGLLAMAMTAKENSYKHIIMPQSNMEEAGLVEHINSYGFNHLNEVITFLLTDGEYNHPFEPQGIIDKQERIEAYDFEDVKGHFQVKRAIEVAVAGDHNLLMIGPPGSGKSMIAKRIQTVLPALTWDEILEVTKLYSVAGELKNNRRIIDKSPFRSPHHSISMAGLIGGGTKPKPGEISLSHHGILFLDELPEFSRSSLESLRQPLEDGVVSISRSRENQTFPADIMLIGAMNPCKCGYYGSDVPNHECKCTPLEVQKYRSRISGPLLDRIDIQIEVPWMSIEALRNSKKGKSSKDMRVNIDKAREIQRERFNGMDIKTNARMNAKQVSKFCVLDDPAEKFLQTSFNQYGFSGRSLDRLLKISRTIADIEESEPITLSHLAEAMNYRMLDKKI